VNCLLIKANLRSAAGAKVPVELSLTVQATGERR
jgi:hypothetical protein